MTQRRNHRHAVQGRSGYVDLKNLVLGEIVLDLEGEQRLVNLARQGLLAGKEEIAGDLHGDGAGASPFAATREVGIGGAQHTEGVYAGMLIETLILRRQDGLLSSSAAPPGCAPGRAAPRRIRRSDDRLPYRSAKVSSAGNRSAPRWTGAGG